MTDTTEKKNGGPRLLVIDIETFPTTCYSFQLFNTNIGVPQIVEPGRVACFAAKWVGDSDDDMIFMSDWEDGQKKMALKIHELFSEASGIIGYNSISFDVRWLQSLLLEHDLAPPSPFHQIDLLRVIRKNFRFVSNKLEFVSKQLDIGEKIKHSGFQLWVDAMNGVPEAEEQMAEYCKQDTLLTETLFELLVPWVDSKVNFGMYGDGEDPTCRHCGSTDLQQIEDYVSKTATYDQYQCNECGGYSRSRKKNQKTGPGVLV